MKQVPLSGRVIFSDWHGVLSRDPFWVSIRSSATHPLRQQLEAGMAGVFASRRNIANEWMKGLLSSDQVIAEMGIQLDGRFREDFLARRLDIDCARMKVNAELFEVLRAMLAEAMVVIATDNMDCFARAFEHSQHWRRDAVDVRGGLPGLQQDRGHPAGHLRRAQPVGPGPAGARGGVGGPARLGAVAPTRRGTRLPGPAAAVLRHITGTAAAPSRGAPAERE